ncbi:MAG: sulfatase-like hydrolase/transferase [Clostridia bacterium]
MNKPNILVLLAEDMCPNLGCYGDLDAITPNLDKLSENGMRYLQANSVAPVCSAARTTMALGMYPFTAGVGNHRSCVKLPENVKWIPYYMRDNGYFTAINKTDYNFDCFANNHEVEGWDTVLEGAYFGDTIEISENMRKTWNKRGDKPFFFMNTYACTHQSKYGFPDNAEHHRATNVPRTKPEEYRDRDKLHIPNYQFDNKESREIWGQYHETITAMDRMVGETIQMLKEDGLYENTVIIFAGDNGMGIPGGKAHMWNEGTHVPMIVHIPEGLEINASAYKKGSVSNDHVNFTDLAPTVISIAGGEIPEHMHGKDFLNIENRREYAFGYRNRIDIVDEFVRSVTSDDFIYLRSFYPTRGWRFSSYMLRMSPYFTTAWENEVRKTEEMSKYTRRNCFFQQGKPVEELYDLKNDPNQMNNLANDPAYKNVIDDMRVKLKDFMISVNDLGFIPEEEAMLRSKATGKTVREIGENYPIEKAYEICDKMLETNVSASEIEAYLNEEEPILKYWAIQCANYLGMTELCDTLNTLASDENAAVKLAASEALIMLGAKDEYITNAKATIGELLDSEDLNAVLRTQDLLVRQGKVLEEFVPNLEKLVKVEVKDPKDQRVAQAICDAATFFPELVHSPIRYEGKDIHGKSRFDVLRELCARYEY